MPTVQVPVQLTVDHLMTAIKQLSPAELHEFMQQLTAWQQYNGQQAEEEAALLARIKESSSLPTAKQRRFDRLRRKRQHGCDQCEIRTAHLKSPLGFWGIPKRFAVRMQPSRACDGPRRMR